MFLKAAASKLHLGLEDVARDSHTLQDARYDHFAQQRNSEMLPANIEAEKASVSGFTRCPHPFHPRLSNRLLPCVSPTALCCIHAVFPWPSCPPASCRSLRMIRLVSVPLSPYFCHAPCTKWLSLARLYPWSQATGGEKGSRCPKQIVSSKPKVRVLR